MLARFQSWPGWILGLLLLAFAVVLNWPVEYKMHATLSIGMVSKMPVDGEGIVRGVPSKPILAGWPLTYYVASETENHVTSANFHLPYLLINILVFSCILTFTWLYERRAHRRNTEHAEKRTTTGKRRFTMGDLMLLVSLLALAFGYWEMLKQRALQQINEIGTKAGNHMHVIMSTQMPKWIHDYYAGWDAKRFMRVREIVLDQPDSESLAYALSFRTLESLRIGGGDYDLKLLQKLHKLPRLVDLRVSGRELNAETVAAIGSCKQLESLNLMRTNITAEGIRALGSMPRLHSLNLVHTDVKLRDLGRPPLADQLQVLLLPHPDAGLTDQLALEDWNELRSLLITEYDTLFNSEPVSVTLRRLPKLTSLGLDHFQMFDLTLDEVPNLRNVASVAYQVRERRSKDDTEASNHSLKRLKIIQSSIYEPIEIDARKLDEISIQTQLPVSLRFVAANPVTQSIDADSSAASVPGLDYQKILNQLGGCSGPMNLDFGRVPMAKVDLSEFARIKGPISLTMAALPSVPVAQLQHASVRELNLSATLLTPAQISELVATTPTLERLSVGLKSLDGISIERSPIKEIVRAPFSQRAGIAISPYDDAPLPAKANTSESFAHLVDVPHLSSAATYLGPLTRARIENAPALTSLRFYYPLPADSSLRGLKNLECFAAGGREFADEHFSAVIGCKGLKTLCLLYSRVSSDKLKEIDQLPALQCLSLNGSQVTDEVVRAWTSLTKLQTLRLKQTQVTLAGLRLILSKFKKLQRLSIDTPLDDEALNDLLKCSELVDLSLHGTELSAAVVKKLLALPALAQLELTDCRIDGEAAQALQLHFAGIDVKRLILINPIITGPAKQSAIETDETQAAIESNATQGSPLRLIHDPPTGLRFYTGRFNRKMREVWLDKDEVWDEPYRLESLNGVGPRR